MTIIEDKDLIYDVKDYDVVLVGLNIMNTMGNGFPHKVAVSFKDVAASNKETAYGDPKKLGSVRVVKSKNGPYFALCYISRGRYRPDRIPDTVDYEALGQCLQLVNRAFKGQKVATTIIGIALAAVAIGIGAKAIAALLFWWRGGTLEAPGMLALWAAVVSILLKELVYQYTVRRGRSLNSPAVEANAWHHRSDALSSVGTLVGIGGAILLGNRWTMLDPLASLVVAFFILRVAWKLMHQGLNELLEASLPEEVEKEILDIVSSFPDVHDPHHLRTRRIGSRYAIELHIRMDGALPLATAHARTCEIEKKLKEHFGSDAHITLHVEPIK